MFHIKLVPYNESFIYCFGSESIEREISDFFSYELPGIRFIKNKNKRLRNWDGRVHIYNPNSKLIPKGLIPRVEDWAQKRGYTIQNDVLPSKSLWTTEDTKSLIQSFPPTNGKDVRDYQEAAITHALKKERTVLISPTGSGKSMILYYLVRHRMALGPVLLVVPTVSLVSQMVDDWGKYGWLDVDSHVHKISAGASKFTNKPVVVSTYQSIYKESPEWFSHYSTLLVDEAHGASSESLKGIGHKMVDCSFRVGVTGTLDEVKSHRFVIEGVFGKGYKVAKTSDLQTRGFLSPIEILAHNLQYSDADRELIESKYKTYQDEIDFVVGHKHRLKYVVDLAGLFHEQNTLVLFQFIEKHGDIIHEKLKAAYDGQRPIYYITGKVPSEDREYIRKIVETHNNAIVLASYGTFSQGVDCPKIHHIILASPSKSRYRVLQSIGRGLRLHETKSFITVHDLVDNAVTKTRVNYLFRHWKVRFKFYKEESFPVKEMSNMLYYKGKNGSQISGY